MASLARPSALRAVRSANLASPVASSSRLSARCISGTAARMAQSGSGGGVGGDEPLIKFASEGPARIYTLNRQRKLNSLNHEMVKLLNDKLSTWRDSDLCDLVVGQGNERGFCAGGDVTALVRGMEENPDTGIKFFKDEFEMNWMMAHLGKPYVAVIDGTTMGGGAGISLPANIRIATSKTVFAMPETNIGYAPDVGANYYLAQLDGFVGAWLAVTGESVFGRTVYELGIATHYISPASVPIVMRDLLALSSPTLAKISSLIASHTAPRAEGAGSKENPDGASPLTPAIRQFIDRTFSLESVSAIRSALDNAQKDGKLSEEVKEWAAAQAKTMDERSPTGMAVALEGYRRAKGAKRLDTVLRNDMTMAAGFTAPASTRPSGDFVTGVTHNLIKKIKDARAAWEPSTFDSPSLTPKSIASRFFDSRNAPHASAIPKLAFKPKPIPAPVEGPQGDELWGKFRACGLPTDSLIGRIVKGEEKDSGAYAVNQKQLLERLSRNDGVRPYCHAPDELRRVVQSAVERKCSVDSAGYLRWEGSSRGQ